VPTLLLLRHAKSAWGDPALSDHERPLNERGRRAAPAMGRRIQAAGFRPDLALCSSARRAQETWSLVAPELEARPRVVVERGLYLCGANALLARLRRLGPEDCVLLVAHNPDLHELAVGLTADGPAAAIRALVAKLPTGALAALALESWRDLAPDSARLLLFATPRGEDTAS
jgi:phosphohistidine phosphatase